MNLHELYSDLHDALALPSRASLIRGILLLIAFILLVIILSAVIAHFSPDPDEFAEEFADKYAGYAYLAIFLITIISSLTVFFPAPGTIIVLALIATLGLNPALAALVASIGGSLGEISAYLVGYAGRATIAPKDSDRYKLAEKWMSRYGGFTIFLFALVPFLIFDLAGVAAGAFKYPVRRFLLFCWMGRLPRSLIECYAGVGLYELMLRYLPW